MKIYKEMSLRDFEPWSGACDTFDHLTDEELDTIEECLEEIKPEGMSETEINDFFWFDTDTIAIWFGFENWESMIEDRNENWQNKHIRP